MSNRGEHGTFLFVVPWSLHHSGGVNQVIINLYRQCERSEQLQPLVLVTDWSQRYPIEKLEVGCRTVHLRIRPPVAVDGFRVRAFLKYLLTLPSTISVLRRLIAHYDIRVINAHYPTLDSFNFVILKTLGLFKGELLLSFHGLDIRNIAKRNGAEAFLWRRLLRRADALIACSDSLGKEIKVYDQVAARALITVRNGVDIDGLLHERQSLHGQTRTVPSRPYILNVATFEDKKGQDILIKAFSRIAADFPDVDLVLIGGDGPTRQKTASLIDEAGLTQRAHCFVNMPHPEVLAFVAGASVFVLPSRAEGLPIALLEAATFALPVVAARVDGIPEVIDSAQTGILFDAEDDTGLEQALRQVLGNRELRAALGQQLQAHVAATFTWQRAWTDYTVLFDTAVQRKPHQLKQQSAYDRGREISSEDIEQTIYRAMQRYCIEDLGLSCKIASDRAAEELQRRIPRAVIAELSNCGIAIASKKVLDLGAGLGGMSEELLVGGAHVTALEPGSAWASITKRRVGSHGDSFRLIEGFGEAVPLPSASVDLVVSLQVLEHVRDPKKVLAEVWRVLRPGGYFYLACENYLAFYEPHYRVPWLPLMPKWLGSLYLRMLRRPPCFLDESITYVTHPGVLRACRGLGFVRRQDEELAKKLHSGRGIKWVALRLMARFTGVEGPLWLNRARSTFKVGIYELFRKPA